MNETMKQGHQPAHAALLLLLLFLDDSVAFAPPNAPALTTKEPPFGGSARRHRPTPPLKACLPAARRLEGSGGCRRSGTSTEACALPPSTWWVLGHVAAGCAAAPVVASATKPGRWYRKIDLPPWNPPDRLFGPVWTTLYACMGLAASRAYRTAKASSSAYAGKEAAVLLLLWAAHFGLNVLWAPVFFGLQRLRLGLVISASMVVTLAMVIPLFYAVNASSAYLLLPYLAWITFATFLNRAICKLNPTQNGYNSAMFQAQLATLQDKAAKYADGA